MHFDETQQFLWIKLYEMDLQTQSNIKPLISSPLRQTVPPTVNHSFSFWSQGIHPDEC